MQGGTEENKAYCVVVLVCVSLIGTDKAKGSGQESVVRVFHQVLNHLCVPGILNIC